MSNFLSVTILTLLMIGVGSCRSRSLYDLDDVSDSEGWRLGLTLQVDPLNGIYEGYTLTLCKDRADLKDEGFIYNAEEFLRECWLPFIAYDQTTQRDRAQTFFKYPENLMKDLINERTQKEIKDVGLKIDDLESTIILNNSVITTDKKEIDRLNAIIEKAKAPPPPPAPAVTPTAPPTRRPSSTQPRNVTPTSERPVVPEMTPQQATEKINKITININEKKTDVAKLQSQIKELEDFRSGINYEWTASNRFAKEESDLAAQFNQIYSAGWQPKAKATVESIPKILAVMQAVHGLTFNCLTTQDQKFGDLKNRLALRDCPAAPVARSPFETVQGNNVPLDGGTFENSRYGETRVDVKNEGGRTVAVHVKALGTEVSFDENFVCNTDRVGVCFSQKPVGLALAIISPAEFRLVNIDSYSFGFTRRHNLTPGVYAFESELRQREKQPAFKVQSVIAYKGEDRAYGAFVQILAGKPASDPFSGAYKLEAGNAYKHPAKADQKITLVSDTVLLYTDKLGSDRLIFQRNLPYGLKDGMYREFNPPANTPPLASMKVTRLQPFPLVFTAETRPPSPSFKDEFTCDAKKCTGKKNYRIDLVDEKFLGTNFVLLQQDQKRTFTWFADN